MTDHPMTEERAAELWDAHAGSTVPWRDWYGGSRRALTSMLRAAFDAGRDHERAQGLPAEYDGAVLVPADGHKAITTTDGQEFSRLTFTTKQSLWYGPNLAARPGDWVIQTTAPGRLTPGTWKEAGK